MKSISFRWATVACAAVIDGRAGDRCLVVFHPQSPSAERKRHNRPGGLREHDWRPVFDDTLKQALAVGLAQSPFLNILSEDKVRKTLQEMTRSPDERLTPDLAREVCQRAGSKVLLSGSIAALGAQYVIGQEAMSCASGEVLAREQVTASGKEQVLPALGRAASKLRNELGESLSSVQKFDVPMEEATTNSLEALKALTLGQKAFNEKGDADAIPFVKRAIELDPNFAQAYSYLAGYYSNLNQPSLASTYTKKAFDLRDRVTEVEKFAITSDYYDRNHRRAGKVRRGCLKCGKEFIHGILGLTSFWGVTQ